MVIPEIITYAKQSYSYQFILMYKLMYVYLALGGG